MTTRPYTHRLVSRIALGAALILALQAIPPLHAADVTWSSTGDSTPGGDGDWTGGSTWWDGSSAVSWTDGDNATFSAAGSTTVNSAVSAGSILFTSATDNISILDGAGDLTINSGITATNTANTAARTFTIGESIALGANQTWTVNSGGLVGTANLAVSGIISGTNLGITKAGNGNLTLSGNNTYTGTTTVSSGTLTLANAASNSQAVVGNIAISGGSLHLETANQIADTSSVTMTSGVLDLWANETINSLSVTGGTVNVRSAVVTSSAFSFTGGQIQFGVRSASFTFNGSTTFGNFNLNWVAGAPLGTGIAFGGDIAVNPGTTTNFTGGGRITLIGDRTVDVGAGANMNVAWGIVGSGSGLTKNGSGTLTLSGANTYNGTTLVSAGSLIVNGSLAAGSSFTVDSGATLGGNGTINGAVAMNGNLAPGTSPGVLTFGNNLTLGSTATVTMELNGTTRGTEYDGVDVTGALTYAGPLDITVGSEFLTGGETFSLFTFGSQSGDFSAVNLLGAYGSGSFTADGGMWSFTDSSDNTWSFDQSNGNLAFAAVPEPSTWALLAFGVGVGVMAIRRRKA